MENKRIYTIQINGIKESIDAVDALNKQLNALESRIKALESANVKVASAPTAGASSTSNLSQEVAIEKELNSLKNEGTKLEAKQVAYQDESYQKVLAQKDILKEIVNDQKAIAAQERLQADTYSNTMQGMKQKLADLKAAINTTDIGDGDSIKKMTKEANELTNKLKEMEEAYGQFGRNVGNYKSAADGFTKFKVQVGDVTREFTSAREASRQLKQELLALGEGAEGAQDLRKAIQQVDSAIKDLNKSSAVMDELLDTMESFAAIGTLSTSFSALLGLDNSEIERSIQKMVALKNVMDSIEKINKQINTEEGIGKWLQVGNRGVDSFVSRLTGAKNGMNGLTKSTVAGTKAVRAFSTALKFVGIGAVIGVILALTGALDTLNEKFNATKERMDNLDDASNALTSVYEQRKDMITSSFLSGEINDEELLAKQYENEAYYLSQQIRLLQQRMNLLNDRTIVDDFFSNFDISRVVNTNFTGKRLSGETTVGAGGLLTTENEDLHITIKNVEELEEAWKKCNEAIKEGKDYLSMWGEGIGDWLDSLIATVNDTRQVMIGLGNVKLSDFVAQIEEVSTKFRKGEIKAEDFAKELKRLVAQMNDSEVLRSVIANLDAYIPDEVVRTKIENIIKQVQRLNDEFNMTSPEQIRYWTQVKIDAMKDGLAKTKAQLKAEEEYELATRAHTEKQKELIRKKYARKRKEAEEADAKQRAQKGKQRGQQENAAYAELEKLKIDNMQEGLDKQIAILNEEKRQKLQRAKDTGIKVGEMQAQIEKLYDKKLLDLNNEWAYQVEQAYKNMWRKIYDINYENQEMMLESDRRNIQLKAEKLKEEASKMLDNAPYDYTPMASPLKESKSEKSYTDLLDKEYTKRIANRREYYSEITKLELDEENKLYENRKTSLVNAESNELRIVRSAYDSQLSEMKTNLKNGLITQEQFDIAKTRLIEETYKKEASISEKYQTQAREEEEGHLNKIKAINIAANNAMVEEYDKAMRKVGEIVTRPMPDNAWGVPNISKILKNNKKVIGIYENLIKDIDNELKELDRKKGLGEISNEDYEKTKTTLNSLKENVSSAMHQVSEDSKQAVVDFVASVNDIFQTVGQAASNILSSLSEITSNQYEAQISEQEKYIDEYEKLLNKQEEITRQHADNVNSIEDELKNARGDRRQQLIDNLNAEMAAQRASLAQQKKIEKEEEKAKEKKKKLEHDQAEAKKKMDLAQAYINAAMAVSMAAVNHWPVPAIPMMALAAAAGAAQIAAVQSQNIPSYGDGGVIQGKSHAQGGIKVLGGRAEVEGGEFITNKVTTSKNVELLDFINSKKKRVNIDDMIEFYGNGTVRKNIQTVRTKFETGGQIPTLRSDISFDDRLLSAFEDYSNRPSIVSVVDILDRSQAVKNVQVIAGLSE